MTQTEQTPHAPHVPHVPRVHPTGPDDPNQPWYLRRSAHRWMTPAALVVLVVLVALDFAVGGYSYFGVDGTFGFYAWYGLLSGVGVVIVAKVLGIFLKRADGYYDVD